MLIYTTLSLENTVKAKLNMLISFPVFMIMFCETKNLNPCIFLQLQSWNGLENSCCVRGGFM